MERSELRAAVMAVLRSVAPEIADEPLLGERPIRDQVDLDSVDWLNVMVGVHTAVGVEIPESDYSRIDTLDRLVDYLATHDSA